MINFMRTESLLLNARNGVAVFIHLMYWLGSRSYHLREVFAFPSRGQLPLGPSNAIAMLHKTE